MKIKIWRLNCSLILFIIYNFIYSVYMAGFMTRTAYLASLAIFLGYSFAHIIYVRSGRIVLGQLKFWDETRLILLTILCFLSITLIRQAFYVNFVPFFVERLLYLALPIVIVFCIMNSNVEDKTIFVYIMLFRMILQFLLVNFNQLTLDNIMSISWFDSSSSLFESSQAHELFIITVLLLCIKRKLLAVIATVLCMLNFKRVSFLFCIVAWIVVPRLKEKSVPHWLVWTCGIGMLTAPFIMQWIYSAEGVLFFQKFGIDLDQFASSRVTLVQMTLKHFAGRYNGYGAIRNFFTNYSEWFAHIGSMHCDVLLIYLECGILGLAVYVIHLLRIAMKDQRVFFVLIYMFMEIVVSQYIELVPAWTVFFLIAALCKTNQGKIAHIS